MVPNGPAPNCEMVMMRTPWSGGFGEVWWVIGYLAGEDKTGRGKFIPSVSGDKGEEKAVFY